MRNNKTLDEFLNGKSPHSVGLFNHLVDEFNSIGAVTIHPLKSMIAIAGERKFAYVIQLGKNFIDVVLPFNQPYTNNLCFIKIKQVPGTNDYNHHLRIFSPDDINDEVRHYIRLGYQGASTAG